MSSNGYAETAKTANPLVKRCECECEYCGAVTHAAERLEVNYCESKLVCVACGTVTKRMPR